MLALPSRFPSRESLCRLEHWPPLMGSCTWCTPARRTPAMPCHRVFQSFLEARRGCDSSRPADSRRSGPDHSHLGKCVCNINRYSTKFITHTFPNLPTVKLMALLIASSTALVTFWWLFHTELFLNSCSYSANLGHKLCTK